MGTDSLISSCIVLEHVRLFSKSFLKPLIGASKIIYNLGDESDPEVDPIRITTTIKQCYIYYNTPDIQVLAIMMCERTIWFIHSLIVRRDGRSFIRSLLGIEDKHGNNSILPVTVFWICLFDLVPFVIVWIWDTLSLILPSFLVAIWSVIDFIWLDLLSDCLFSWSLLLEVIKLLGFYALLLSLCSSEFGKRIWRICFTLISLMNGL